MEQSAKEVVLTYETIYELLRREKSREELQKLDETFIRDSLHYLREKQQAHDDNLTKNDIFSQSERDKLHIQLANIRKLLKDLYDIRERKIINMAINKSRTNSHIVDTENLQFHEKAMFEAITTVLNQYRGGVLHRIIETREPDVLPVVLPLPEEAEEETPSANTRIKFIDAVDQFAGPELELYGPYQPEDEAELPRELADILVSQGKAAEIQQGF